jgi:hypothetical protein
MKSLGGSLSSVISGMKAEFTAATTICIGPSSALVNRYTTAGRPSMMQIAFASVPVSATGNAVATGAHSSVDLNVGLVAEMPAEVALSCSDSDADVTPSPVNVAIP